MDVGYLPLVGFVLFLAGVVVVTALNLIVAAVGVRRVRGTGRFWNAATGGAALGTLVAVAVICGLSSTIGEWVWLALPVGCTVAYTAARLSGGASNPAPENAAKSEP